ncbi:hypothetical protein BKA70DRAFT_1493699, partial [Coprinopsis sp. MPI-PUGE-AT-0042]
MHFLLVALAVSLASFAHAEDVTLFVVPLPSGTASPLYSVSILGDSPLSVYEAGATDYVYSQAYSWIEKPIPSISGVFTLTRTLKADATREVTTTVMGDVVEEDRYECVHHKNGTSVCQNRIVMKEAGTTSTWLDETVTGTPSPSVTIKGVESAYQQSLESAYRRR